jgi:hypothetical protein
MDPETSRARISDDADTGTSTLSCGRALARPREARAASTRANGTWRRQPERVGRAALSSATLEYAIARRRRRPMTM